MNSSNTIQTAQACRLARGNIRRVEGLLGLPTQPQLALILRTENLNQDYTEVMLVHDRVEMATLDDVVVDPESDQFPDGLVVQTLLRGAVWNLQFSTLYGQLSPDDIAAVGRATSPGASHFEEATAGQKDLSDASELNQFHESQLQALWSLTGDCTDAALDTLSWRIDPWLLSAQLLANYQAPEHIVSELMHILRTRYTTTTFEDSQALIKSGALMPATWKDTSYGSNLASQIASGARSLVEAAFRDAAHYAEQLNQGTKQLIAPNRSSEAGRLTLMPYTRLVTAPFLWADGGHELIRHSHEDDGSQPLEVMMLATPESSADTTQGVTHVC